MRSITKSVISVVAFAFALGLGCAAVQAADPTVPGVSFNGGDGSYKRVVANGITLGISNDPPYTYQDEKTKQYDGIDVQIFTEICKRLGITNVKWEIVQFDALIPGIGAKRWDVVVDNLHENPKRLAVVAFTSPAYCTVRLSPWKRATRRTSIPRVIWPATRWVPCAAASTRACSRSGPT